MTIQDTDIATADNVVPLQTGATAEAKPARKRDTRAAARQAKKRSQNKGDRDVRRRAAMPVAIADAPPIAPVVAMPVTPDVMLTGPVHAVAAPSRRTSRAPMISRCSGCSLGRSSRR
jgi:hypothetical protein